MNLPYKLMAYINGVRFYPAGCNYVSTEGSHAQFSLTVPAVPHWSILPERSHCAVFFTDPVANSWRLLCEGEYIGDTRQKSAIGTRYRSLAFRSTHALFQSTTYAGMVGLVSGGSGQASTADQVQTAYASGIETRTGVPPGGKGVSDFDLVRTDLIKFITDFSQPGTQLSTFLPSFIKAVMQQLPVDAFYSAARRLNDKVFALADAEISGVIDATLFNDLVRQSFMNSVSANSTIESIICGLENIAYYQHVTVPAPPIYFDNGASSGFTIPELLFIPQLYTAVPPACNVVFRDQVTDISGSRNFMAEPTRVITQLTAAVLGVGDQPLFFMSNDTERSVNVSAVIAGKNNQTNNVAPPGTLVMHDFLTLEEYTRGVIPVVVPFTFQNLFTKLKDKNAPTNTAAPNPTQDDAQSRKIINYVGHSSRHFYDVARGAQRRMQVNCTFLPYIVPGFPCLIEDSSGSFWGMVNSVTHTLMATGQPSTTLDVTHVREAYILDGHVRNSYNPLWLNSAFLPSKINETYKKLFGGNAPDAINAGEAQETHAAMVPASLILGLEASNADVPLNALDQVDLDRLAAFVIPTLHYSRDGQLVSSGESDTVAEKIRRTDDVQLNCLKFQYRAGTTLTQFSKFHSLPAISESANDVQGGGVANHPDYIFSKTPPPSDLSPGLPDRLFGTPYRMIFEGQQAAIDVDNPYGVYRLQQIDGKDITYFRQQAALTIRAAIDQTITEG